ncbi:hypothetical protein N7510_000282 [Penicillium lagena]|uniref:uncharacterized protein n=1 Tax=Penicillium lagena TaxID=94218 RepID=UPI002540C3B6|nr:uncharacterized protein N7510_000282 [Penicillium lagena]KAJ5623973.1 hypothetical protein N7510_000282 [Penicillium lagena]
MRIPPDPQSSDLQGTRTSLTADEFLVVARSGASGRGLSGLIMRVAVSRSFLIRTLTSWRPRDVSHITRLLSAPEEGGNRRW